MLAKLLGAVALRILALLILIFAAMHLIVGIVLPDRMTYFYAGLCFLVSALCVYRLASIAFANAIQDSKELQD
jgi:hypothetical protein